MLTVTLTALNEYCLYESRYKLKEIKRKLKECIFFKKKNITCGCPYSSYSLGFNTIFQKFYEMIYENGRNVIGFLSFVFY